MAQTTLAVSDELHALLETAMAASGAKTEAETIELALRELIRTRERERLRQQLGTFDLDLTVEELRRQRRAG